MTVPPYYEPPHDHAGVPGWGYPPGAQPWAPAGPPVPPKRSRRGIVVAASVAGAIVLGGAGVAVGAYLSGGGTQPEDVLPADTVGFVRIDLDPSLGQKIDLMSLLDRFPDVVAEVDRDLRAEVMDPLIELSGARLDYATDVQPWLGDRMAVAAVPAEDSPEGVVPVVALAVTDEQLMTDALGRAQEAADFGFAVRDDYVLITDSQDRADGIATAEDSLADDADFAGDLDALGDDQIALAWADLSALEGLMATQIAPEVAPGDLFGGEALSGRVILGVHATDDALEIVGLDFGVSDLGAPSGEPTRLAHTLPEDTLAALSLSGVGDQAVAAWEQLEASGGLAGVEGEVAGLGLDLPDDLRTILGTDLAVAVFGDLENLAFGARVATEQPQEAIGLLDSVLNSAEFGLPAVYSEAAGGYVVATDQATLDALMTDGSLADTDAFRSAVADPETASAIGFVDLGNLVDQLVAQGGNEAEQARKFRGVEALGFSATSTDEGGRFVLRITVS